MKGRAPGLAAESQPQSTLTFAAIANAGRSWVSNRIFSFNLLDRVAHLSLYAAPMLLVGLHFGEPYLHLAVRQGPRQLCLVAVRDRYIDTSLGFEPSHRSAEPPLSSPHKQPLITSRLGSSRHEDVASSAPSRCRSCVGAQRVVDATHVRASVSSAGPASGQW